MALRMGRGISVYSSLVVTGILRSDGLVKTRRPTANLKRATRSAVYFASCLSASPDLRLGLCYFHIRPAPEKWLSGFRPMDAIECLFNILGEQIYSAPRQSHFPRESLGTGFHGTYRRSWRQRDRFHLCGKAN